MSNILLYIIHNKKKHLCIIILFFIILVILFVYVSRDEIYRQYEIGKISKILIDTQNGAFNNSVSKSTIKSYQDLNKSIQELNQHDITELIDNYTNLLKESVEIFALRQEDKSYLKETKIVRTNRNGILGNYGEIITKYDSGLCYSISYDISNIDIENYRNGTFEEKLIEYLKKCLDYETIDNKIKWMINLTEDSIIELPYNCYINYKADKIEKNYNFKKANKVLDKTQINIDKINKSGQYISIQYVTTYGDIKTDKVSIRKNIDGTYVIGLLNHKRSFAEAELCSHTEDRLVSESIEKGDEVLNKMYYNNPDSLFNKPFDFDTWYEEQSKN